MEGDDSGARRESEERGGVARPENQLGRLPDPVGRDPGQQIEAAVAAAGAEERRHSVVGEEIQEVVRSFFGGPGGVLAPGQKVLRTPGPETHPAQLLLPGLEEGKPHRTRRRDNPDGRARKNRGRPYRHERQSAAASTASPRAPASATASRSPVRSGPLGNDHRQGDLRVPLGRRRRRDGFGVRDHGGVRVRLRRSPDGLDAAARAAEGKDAAGTDQHTGADQGAVQEGPVRAAEVVEVEFPVAEHEPGVLAAHRDMIEPDRTRGRTADPGLPSHDVVTRRRFPPLARSGAGETRLHHERIQGLCEARAVARQRNIPARRRASGARSGPSWVTRVAPETAEAASNAWAARSRSPSAASARPR